MFLGFFNSSLIYDGINYLLSSQNRWPYSLECNLIYEWLLSLACLYQGFFCSLSKSLKPYYYRHLIGSGYLQLPWYQYLVSAGHGISRHFRFRTNFLGHSLPPLSGWIITSRSLCEKMYSTCCCCC